jgi:hypothetical protein
MSVQGISQLGEMLEAQGLCLVNPGVQECLSELFVGKIPKATKILFEKVRGVEGFIDLHEHHEPFKGTGVEMFKSFEQEKTAARDDLFFLAAELSNHIPSRFIDSPVDQCHHMVGVMDNVCRGQDLRNGLQVSRGHIHGYRQDVALPALELFKERDQGMAIFALMDVNDVSGFKIEHHGHRGMSFADGKFIDCEVSNRIELSSSEPPREMILEDLLDQIPANTQKESHMSDRGNGTQIEHIPFKGLEPASLAFGKVDGLTQGPTALPAALNMTVQDDKLRSSSHGQCPKGAFKFPVHGQLIPLSATVSAPAFIPFPGDVVIDSPSPILGPQVLVAHQAQSMLQITCRRHGPYPPCFDLLQPKRGYTAVAMMFSNLQLLFTPAFAG